MDPMAYWNYCVVTRSLAKAATLDSPRPDIPSTFSEVFSDICRRSGDTGIEHSQTLLVDYAPHGEYVYGILNKSQVIERATVHTSARPAISTRDYPQRQWKRFLKLTGYVHRLQYNGWKTTFSKNSKTAKSIS
ncbi:hypothetical protein TNCV_1001461 [Trichonephila clavipes]|nr:hypothetical protein TNCV_1001461 [Trichonephila clavipes]